MLPGLHQNFNYRDKGEWKKLLRTVVDYYTLQNGRRKKKPFTCTKGHFNNIDQNEFLYIDTYKVD